VATVHECPGCGEPVYFAILRGVDIMVDPDPAPDGHLELAGLWTLHKPIAIVHPQTTLPGVEPRYRPHLASCSQYADRRAMVPA
jgi:hypothetical protein